MFYYEEKRKRAEESEREDNTIKTCGADADAKLLRAKEHEEESRRKKKTQAKVSRTKMTGNESLLPKYRLSEPIRARVMRQLSQLEPEARTKMKV